MRPRTPLVALLAHSAAALSVVDTHVHNANLTLMGDSFYTFPTSFPDLATSWFMPDFAAEVADVTAISVDRVVLMELEKVNNTFDAGRAEAAFYQATADGCRVDPASCGGAQVAGFVASAPLEQDTDSVREYLADLRASFPQLVGIREGLWLSDSAFFADPGFRAGLATLAEFDLAFDLLVEKEQLQDTAALAAAVPNVVMNVNHLGYPNISDPDPDHFASWAADLQSLAQQPNVFLKLSGLPQCYGQPGWSAGAFTPYIKTVLDAFGAQRVNFAGNWFVLVDDEWEGDYGGMVDAALQSFSDLSVSQTDLEWIFSKTAEEIYGL